MKNLFFTLGLILVHYISYAQINTLKIGYADQNYIYSNLPDYKVFNNEIEVSAAKYQNILKEKYTLYQQKIDMYQNDVKNQAASAVLKDKESELQNLQKSIQDFQKNSEADLKLMYQKKFAPIKEKVDNAITQYGKNNGYTYILRLQTEETAGETWPILLYANDPTGDVSKGVLLKLGVSTPSIGSQNKVGLSVGLKK